MIENGNEIKVVDAKSNEDITRSVLMQLIVEKESTEVEALFATAFWMKSVRLYNSPMGHMFADHIHNILDAFVEHQSVIEAQTQEMFDGLASNPFIDLAEKNIDIWRAMLESMSTTPSKHDSTEQQKTLGDHAEELKDIKEQIAGLAQQLSQLQDSSD